ncbi:MAG: copper resistance protein CopC/CopD [Chloroflexi bacterium]|nr:copper resistance protein CopC/CopD [Chloroflexota bacterium]
MTNRIRKYCNAPAALLLAAVVLLLSSSIVLAHAAFVRSEPAPNSVLPEPPSAVTIWFTEPVETSLSEIIVLDATGKRVNTENAKALPEDPKALRVLLPRLPNGTYTVAFKNFSRVDGHSLSGSFIFSVGVPLPAAPALPAAPGPEQPLVQYPIEIVLRWLGLLSILAIVGCLVFELSISRSVLNVDNATQTMQSMDRRMESRTLDFVWLATVTFLAASIGELIVKTSAAGGIPLFQVLGRPIASVLQTGWGNIWLWRTSLLVGMIMVLVMVSLERRKRGLSGRREWQIVALAFAAGILLMISMVSHGAATTEIRAAAIFSDYLHLLAASVWIGGIFYLALVVPPVMKAQRGQPGNRRGSRAALFCPETHVTAIDRFSSLAMLSVGTLFITGLFSSWAQVTVLPALATPHGVTLLIKMGLIIPLLILGAVNRFWTRPRLAHDGRALQLLRKTLTAETILAVLVILSVGILVNLEPARQAAARQTQVQSGRLTLQSTTEGVNVKAIIEPGTLGLNLVTIFLTDRSGRPVTNARAVILQLTYLDKDIGSSTESTIDHGSGIWVAHEAFLNVAGNWQASLVIQRPGAFDERTSFRFRIPFSPESSVIAPSAETGKRLWGIELLLLGFLYGGIGLYAGGWKTRAGMLTIVCGGIAILAGLLMVIMSVLE